MAIVLKGATLIDGTGDAPLKDSLLVIEGSKISFVGSVGKARIPEGSEVIDLAGKTVIPGLIDLHVHMEMHGMANNYDENLVEDKLRTIRSVKEMQNTLHNGITTVRNVGSVNNIDFAVKEAIENGWFDGPRILTCGKIISMTAMGNDYFLGLYREADGCDEVRKAAREQLKAGADFLKLMATGAIMNPGGIPGVSQLSREEMTVVVDEASKLGLKVAAHAHGKQGIIDAIEAGVATIEHGTFIDDEVIELMLERKVYLVPTFVLHHLMIKHGTKKGVPSFMIEKIQLNDKQRKENLRKAINAGVLIAFGTDAGTNYNYHGNNVLELVLLVEEGFMSPVQAICSATKISAEALGLFDEIGSLENGKEADIVVVNGSLVKSLRPLIDEIEIVIKGGERIR